MQTFGFFDSVNGDRKYNAAQMTEYFDGLVSNGVYQNVGQAMVVTAAGGMAVNVGKGRAIIDCRWLKNDAVLPVEITAANAALPRYTAVVVRLDYTARKMEITTKDGTAAATPVQPTMSNTDDLKEICLAMVYVAANATNITQANITDMRSSSLCGWVTGLIEQVDTSTLFLQWQDAYQSFYDNMAAGFYAWMDTLTQDLSVNTFVKKFRQETTTTSDRQEIVFEQDGYVYNESDVILVYINGLLAVETTDYRISGYDSAHVFFVTVNCASGQDVSIVVLKSKIGFYVVGTPDGDALVTSENEVLVP